MILRAIFLLFFGAGLASFLAFSMVAAFYAIVS
jgi:hypothetical protein